MDILENISSLAKRRGFIYPGSDIYGGLSGTWDYGPLGVELKRNLKESFWRSLIGDHGKFQVVGIDAAILMNPKVWEASGHVQEFNDPLVECYTCHHRFRADHLESPKCPDCGGKLTEPKQFNLLMETSLGAVAETKQKVYLRGEITQGTHVNFKNIMGSTRVKVPFGVLQIGKAFRNEITPGQLSFRSREFEQMEMQFYVRPDKKEADKWFEYWKEERMKWYLSLGFRKENLRFRDHAKDELAHYAQRAVDIEYQVTEGEWKEMEGIHHRGDWDLRRHQEFSKVNLEYFDEEAAERFIPWVIETSGGVDRALLFFLMDAYREEKIKGDEETRTVLKLSPKLAPYQIAVFPLLGNKEKLSDLAREIFDDLRSQFRVSWDDRGNIGKRYRYQDEMGTMFCLTVDFESLTGKDLTVRYRDSMEQVRVKIEDLPAYLAKQLGK
ncbi:MAG: glycine--tRNA ligase [bacterium]|nr:glycine--tRNA ligase [bacterium]